MLPDFRDDLARWTLERYADDGIITVNIDRKANYGPGVTRKEAKHTRRTFKEAERVIDLVTGDAFDVKFTKKHRQADILVYAYDPGHPQWLNWRGVWSAASGELGFSTGFIDSATFTTITHEIGHVFGLGHPTDMDTHYGYYPDTVMAGRELLVNFTPGDLTVLQEGWTNLT